jgi:hypothetical protein
VGLRRVSGPARSSASKSGGTRASAAAEAGAVEEADAAGKAAQDPPVRVAEPRVRVGPSGAESAEELDPTGPESARGAQKQRLPWP